MSAGRLVRLAQCLVFALVVFESGSALPQTESLTSRAIGMDNQYVFPHVSLPGATGIDFSFTGAFSPTYPPEASHVVVITFEWGTTATGPWSSSPDNVNTVPGGVTDLFATGVYHGPDDAPFVALHFHAGGLMFVVGEFTHASVVPEPRAAVLMALGVSCLLALTRRRSRGTRQRLLPPSG